MTQETFWILLSKKLSGESTTEELQVLENLILEHPEWQYAVQNLEELWKQQPKKDHSEEEDAYMLHLHRMQELNIPFGKEPENGPVPITRKPKRLMTWFRAAAAIFILAGAWLLLGRFLKTGNDRELAAEGSEITTRPGSTSKVKLPDGSVVWLNAGSKLTYNKDFGKELREVTLSGEGFFDVTKMKEKPFIIHTSTINIKVLGTVFNVRAYPEDKHTETSLIRGSIEVTIKNRPNDKIILSPSEKLVVENDKITAPDLAPKGIREQVPVTVPLVAVNKLLYSPVDSSVEETAWMDNRIVFRSEPFEELAIRMERAYDVRISIASEDLKEEKLNGTFDNLSITQALEALTEMIPSLHFEKNGNQIIFKR